MFQSGDGRAFEDLYKRYFQRIYRYCLKRVGDAHEAEELAQEAFVRAYSAMPRLTGERRFYPWLSVIASRLCVDTHRRRGRTTPAAVIELGVVEGGQEDVIAEVDREILTRALAKMSDRHREVLHLREQEGWSYDRIATHLNVGVGTVEALLFRARRALRREFNAIAGDGRFASLPVVAYLLRRMVDVRQRFGDLAQHAAPMVAAGAVSVAVVVGTVVAHDNVGHAPVKAHTADVPEVQFPALSPVSIDPAHTSTAGVSSVAPPAKPVTPPKASGLMTADEAKAQSMDAPVRIDLGIAGVAITPPELPPVTLRPLP
ncbi:MAG TPA: RNA polymerase sigma factor [Acidimicrobiales bacterium]|nr:RNA polymerase sigma factor [Acidimicrobiales bacterium]